MKAGATYGYRAIVRIPVSMGPYTGLSTKKGYMGGDLVAALQADLALIGLIVTQYKVTGQTPNYGIALEVVPMKGFFSTQSIKQLIDQAIKQQTGILPVWSEDPTGLFGSGKTCCITKQYITCCDPCSPCYGALVKNPCYDVTKATLSLVSPQGQNAYLPGGSANNIVATAPTNLLGAAYGAGETAYNDVQNAAKRAAADAAKVLTATVVAVVGLGLLALFIFGKAGGTIG